MHYISFKAGNYPEIYATAVHNAEKNTFPRISVNKQWGRHAHLAVCGSKSEPF